MRRAYDYWQNQPDCYFHRPNVQTSGQSRRVCRPTHEGHVPRPPTDAPGAFFRSEERPVRRPVRRSARRTSRGCPPERSREAATNPWANLPSHFQARRTERTKPNPSTSASGHGGSGEHLRSTLDQPPREIRGSRSDAFAARSTAKTWSRKADLSRQPVACHLCTIYPVDRPRPGPLSARRTNARVSYPSARVRRGGPATSRGSGRRPGGLLLALRPHLDALLIVSELATLLSSRSKRLSSVNRAGRRGDRGGEKTAGGSRRSTEIFYTPLILSAPGPESPKRPLQGFFTEALY